MEFGPHGGPFFNRTREPSVIVPRERDLLVEGVGRWPPDIRGSWLPEVEVLLMVSLSLGQRPLGKISNREQPSENIHVQGFPILLKSCSYFSKILPAFAGIEWRL